MGKGSTVTSQCIHKDIWWIFLVVVQYRFQTITSAFILEGTSCRLGHPIHRDSIADLLITSVTSSANSDSAYSNLIIFEQMVPISRRFSGLTTVEWIWASIRTQSLIREKRSPLYVEKSRVLAESSTIAYNCVTPTQILWSHIKYVEREKKSRNWENTLNSAIFAYS